MGTVARLSSAGTVDQKTKVSRKQGGSSLAFYDLALESQRVTSARPLDKAVTSKLRFKAKGLRPNPSVVGNGKIQHPVWVRSKRGK